jgi:hypothetical protein
MRRAFLVPSLLVLAVSSTACDAVRENQHPVCEVRSPTVLMAESVKTAAFVPCVRSLPIGWSFESFSARDGVSTYSLDSEVGGRSALVVTFRRSCRVVGTEARSGTAGVRLTRDVRSSDPYRARWTYTFDGGCAVYAIDLAPGSPVARLLREIETGTSFLSRGTIDRTLERQQGRGLGPASA